MGHECGNRGRKRIGLIGLEHDFKVRTKRRRQVQGCFNEKVPRWCVDDEAEGF